MSWRLNSAENCFVLSIEAETAIFCVAVCCDVEIELLASANQMAIMSFSPPDVQNGFPILASFRCQESTNRLEIQFRAKEGNPGCITCFTVPKMNPKMALMGFHKILPLCLHERAIDQEDSKEGSRLIIAGDFTSEEICLWFSSALPNFPRQWPTDGGLSYCNAQTGNKIWIILNKDLLSIWSQDISSLDILREILVKESLARNIKFKVEFKPDFKNIEGILRSLWEKVEFVRALEEKTLLSKALREIQQVESNKYFRQACSRKRIVKELMKNSMPF